MKWIAIKDQLPPMEQDVLLWFDDPVVVYRVGYLASHGEILIYDDDDGWKAAPTLWAEITPPENEETK